MPPFAAITHRSRLDRRAQFLFDLTLLGEAVAHACRANGLRRINYEVLGNSIPVLHGHVHARYEWEPADKIGGPVWRYPKEVRNDPEHAYPVAKHGELRARSRRSSADSKGARVKSAWVAADLPRALHLWYTEFRRRVP